MITDFISVVHRSTMSSTKNLDSIVILDSTNFKQWKAAIMAYAMLNGFWDAFDASLKPVLVDPTKVTAKEKKDLREWHQMDQRGMGLIRSKVNPSIQAVFDTLFTLPAPASTGTGTSVGTGLTSGSASALVAASAVLKAMSQRLGNAVPKTKINNPHLGLVGR
jgi:hypothetical protein